MSASTPALITPTIAKWARERVGISRDTLAKRLKTSPTRIASWETGEVYPSMQQAEKLAHTLNVPLGYLFLTDPPQERLALPDFRTAKNVRSNNPSPNLLDLINDVTLKQQWYRDFLIERGSARLSFVGKFKTSDNLKTVADDIRSALKLTEHLRKICPTVDDLLRELSANAESAGILVLRSSVVGSNNKRKLATDEFRGFAISDEYAPTIFINGADFVAGQIFTLVHELAHIWIGASGISNPALDKNDEDSSEIERFCNSVAAEVLIPASDFLRFWDDKKGEANLELLKQAFKVSSLVALRRALELGKISKDVFFSSYAQQQREFEASQTRKKSSEGGGDFYATLNVHNSKLFTRTLVESALEGRTLYRDAARLLNVQVPTIFGIAERFRQNG